ncbi:adenylate/guanylate cyclase domain-containing protein [Sulfitobacter sp. TSTF-M16]|uniref:Adenylate/guanylate cyclase domain-containing protein n=3 Tax=Sulfitobacter aestuariivivens TaxID=2766981 RepID=A0A927D997_9RHOB|nr:adenylate/guanylate cyclase domain-containing protein [Sulfitobacter aestuariivivens]
MKRPKTQYAKCGELNIAYQVFGDGPFDLLFALGWLTNVEYGWESPDYSRFLKKLGQRARVIVFDKRGTGMSDRDVGVATLEQRSEDINAVLDAVGSERAVLFGVSEGGAMSSVFAATFPERVSHLILNGSRSKYQWAEDYPYGLQKDEAEAEIAGFIENWGEPFALLSGAPSISKDHSAAEWYAAYLRYSASPRTAENFTRMNYQIDYRDILQTIQVPTMILHREDDQWCPIFHARYLAANIPKAELRVIPGDDHIVWYGDQDRLIAEIEQFVSGETSSSSYTRALRTVMFLDIVGSTNHLAAMGDDRWKSILEQLDFNVDRRIASFDGIRIKHTGDGYLISFSGPTRAIECAKMISEDVQRLGLQCQIGVHTGECELRGEDLSGLAVHIAARIMSEAEPQTIMCSQTVKDLVVGSGLEFVALGSRELKGVPGEWVMYEVK